MVRQRDIRCAVSERQTDQTEREPRKYREVMRRRSRRRRYRRHCKYGWRGCCFGREHRSRRWCDRDGWNDRRSDVIRRGSYDAMRAHDKVRNVAAAVRDEHAHDVGRPFEIDFPAINVCRNYDVMNGECVAAVLSRHSVEMTRNLDVTRATLCDIVCNFGEVRRCEAELSARLREQRALIGEIVLECRRVADLAEKSTVVEIANDPRARQNTCGDRDSEEKCEQGSEMLHCMVDVPSTARLGGLRSLGR